MGICISLTGAWIGAAGFATGAGVGLISIYCDIGIEDVSISQLFSSFLAIGV